ncbi:hypothetical protein [Leptospira ryugenii]|nr:hypothetical protein [Leptospira ryugenii]
MKALNQKGDQKMSVLSILLGFVWERSQIKTPSKVSPLLPGAVLWN